MSSNKTVGGQAKELVLLFYDLTGIKFTNRDIMLNVRNVKHLLETFTYDEIEDTSRYCVANPPDRGIYSFGYITYNISPIVAQLKNMKKKVMKETAIKESDLKEYDLNKSNHDMIDDIFRG